MDMNGYVTKYLSHRGCFKDVVPLYYHLLVPLIHSFVFIVVVVIFCLFNLNNSNQVLGRNGTNERSTEFLTFPKWSNGQEGFMFHHGTPKLSIIQCSDYSQVSKKE